MFQRIALFILGIGFATSADAGFIYNLGYSLNTVTLNSGDTIQVNVLLQETATGSDTPRLGSLSVNNRVNGLSSASFTCRKRRPAIHRSQALCRIAV